MKYFSTVTALAFTASVGMAMLPGSANAWVKWTVSTYGYCTMSGYVDGNTRTCDSDTSGVGTVTGSAFSNTEPNTVNTQLAIAELNAYSSGLGVTHGDTNVNGVNDSNNPQHSIDNDQRFDLVLFEFEDNVRLEDLAIGWIGPYASSNGDSDGQTDYEDADISVLAYTGPSAPSLVGKEYNAGGEGLTGSGWELLGNFDVCQGGTAEHGGDGAGGSAPTCADNQTINLNNSGTGADSNVSSSYWLVGAYNPVFAGCSSCDFGYRNYDFFKLKALFGKVVDTPNPPSSVSAPTTLMLAGLTMTPILMRRRRQRVALVAKAD